MNEQDIILRKKIEKREKIDTIIAYVLLVILLGCIALVIYLKLSDNNKLDVPVDEYTPNYISLGEISTSLNGSVLANRYMNESANFTSVVSANVIMVNYTKEDNIINLNIPVVGNELNITFSNEDKEIAEEIYKEIATIICMYYGNEETYCRNTLDTMSKTGNDGIRIIENDDTTNIYIATTKSYTVNDKITYTEVTMFDLKETDYKLILNDVIISNISIFTTENNLVFTGNIDNTFAENFNPVVVVKLYDNENNVLEENKYENNEETPLEESASFQIEFALNNSLKLEDISKYSIEIIKEGE